MTGRSKGDGECTIDTTARQVTGAVGEGRAIQCALGIDAESEALFARIVKEVGRSDLLI